VTPTDRSSSLVRGDLTQIDRLAADVVRGVDLRFQPGSSGPKLAHPRSLNFIIDQGGSALTSGVVRGLLGIDDPFFITGVELVADQPGTLSIDIQRASFVDIPSFVSLIGGGGTVPTLTSTQTYADPLMTGWTSRQLLPDDWLRFQILASPAPASCTWLSVKLRLRPGS